MKENASREGYEKSAYLYDLFDQKANIEFFHHYASQAKEILDIGAGTGRIALPLARRGIRVCCVEPSLAMWRVFKKKLAQQPEAAANIELIAGEASSFTSERTFPVAFLSGCFDHFLDDGERIASLQNIGRHLNEGGKLIFDLFLGLMEDSPLSPAGSVQVGNREYRRFVGGKILPGKKKETRLIFEIHEDGALIERISERSMVGLTSRKAVHQLLSQTGFRIESEWGDYDFSPYQESSQLLIIAAGKET